MAVIDFPGDDGAADAEAEAAVEPVQGVVKGAGVGKGAEVSGTVLFFRADGGEAREGIAHLDAHVEEAFVIAESDIVTRPVVFDQLALQQERFLLVADHVDLEIVDGIHQGAGLEIRPGFPRGGEIGGEAAFQIQGLADINDRPEAVLHQVDAGLVGNVAKLRFQLLGDHWWDSDGISWAKMPHIRNVAMSRKLV